jgi:hypothetical protein
MIVANDRIITIGTLRGVTGGGNAESGRGVLTALGAWSATKNVALAHHAPNDRHRKKITASWF